MTTTHDDDYLVTVCDHCLTASCWHGVFMCDMAQGAGTVNMRASTLRKLDMESPDNYSRDRLLDVCGSIAEVEHGNTT